MHLLKSKVSDPWGAEWTEKHLASEDDQEENQKIHFMGPYVTCPLYQFIVDVNQLNRDSRYTKLTHLGNKPTACSMQCVFQSINHESEISNYNNHLVRRTR